MAGGRCKKLPRKRFGFSLMYSGAPKTPSAKPRKLRRNFHGEACALILAYTEGIFTGADFLPASLPFAPDFLKRHWPLLLESCALQPDRARIPPMVAEI